MIIDYKESYDYLKLRKYKTSSIMSPKDNTIVYISKKIEFAINNLYEVCNCFVFCDKEIYVKDDLNSKHIFCIVENPAAAFGITMEKLYQDKIYNKKFIIKNRVEMGENIQIGENTVLDPDVVIGHDVCIGSNCHIMRGCILKACRIGDNCNIYERVLIGNIPYNYYIGEQGESIRMSPTGNIIIGSNVDIGANSIIDCGTVSSTIIGDNVKIDVNCHIGHDANIRRDVMITGYSLIGAFSQIGERTHIYSSKILKRIQIGKDVEICFNSCVMKDVRDGEKVLGYPARVIGHI